MSVIFHVIKFFNHEESIRVRSSLPYFDFFSLSLFPPYFFLGTLSQLVGAMTLTAVIEMTSYIVVICVYEHTYSIPIFIRCEIAFRRKKVRTTAGG